jgi:hypothetical protein
LPFFGGWTRIAGRIASSNLIGFSGFRNFAAGMDLIGEKFFSKKACYSFMHPINPGKEKSVDALLALPLEVTLRT